MANLTMDEFEQCLAVLADGGSPAKLRDRLVRLNAFHTRRGLGTLRAISDRLYNLSSGLRRDVPPTRAFQALWIEHVGSKLTKRSGEKLDQLAETINEKLEEDGSLKEGAGADLEAQVAEYEDFLSRKIGGAAARLDMLQKAVPVVADLLRGKPLLDVPLDPPEEEDADDHAGHDHHGHDHHHGHEHHDHGHDRDHDHDEKE